MTKCTTEHVSEYVTERVSFRFFKMPCCGHLLCWVNPRLPSFCPECGRSSLMELRTNGEHTLVSDSEAFLKFKEGVAIMDKLFIFNVVTSQGRVHRNFLVQAPDQKEAAKIFNAVVAEEEAANEPIIPKGGHTLSAPVEFTRGVFEV